MARAHSGRKRARSGGRSSGRSGKSPAKTRDRWAYLTRALAEQDVIETIDPKLNPAQIGEGVVIANGRGNRKDGTPASPAFARQAMRTSGRSVAPSAEIVADALAAAILAAYPQNGSWPWTLQVVAPDSRDPKDPRRAVATQLDEAITEPLDARLETRISDGYVDDPAEADRLAQAWIVDPETVLVGFTAVDDALTRSPGGRLRLSRDADMPSRSGLKLQEAIEWIGLGPEKGDQVIDLGAAPGGWSSIAVRRGARVIAVDKKPLALTLPPKKIRFVGMDAFAYHPEETADWLLCDIAQRPLDVAKLIAKWGRRVWARQLIASFKLPMKQKASNLVKILDTLEEGGWRGLKARQLFYDKNEITVFGWLDPRTSVRGYRG